MKTNKYGTLKSLLEVWWSIDYITFISRAWSRISYIHFVISGSNYDSLIVRTVAFPVQVAYWTKRSWPPAEIVSHDKFDQWSGDMAVGSCGLVAIHA